MVRTCYEGWLKKCMMIKVEIQRVVGRPRNTWLKNVESYMMGLVDVLPYRKTYCKPMISIFSIKWSHVHLILSLICPQPFIVTNYIQPSDVKLIKIMMLCLSIHNFTCPLLPPPALV